MNQLLRPQWLEDEKINEVLFCTDFLAEHPMLSISGQFYTPEGRISDENQLKKMIYDLLKPYITTNLNKRVMNLIDVLRMECCAETLPVEQDRIHVANGTLFLDGTFTEEKGFCRNRLPVNYHPEAPPPARWLTFMEELLYPSDLPVLQEYLGYCLIPSTRAQKMLMILGRGGEGKSRVGLIMGRMLGDAAVVDSIQKVETNRFARADLEGKLLMIDDDMDMNTLPKTNTLKTIVTAESRMDLERKGVQSYQGQIYARFLCFGNGELISLNDQSKGFYRRQLVLYTKDPPEGRKDDPFLLDRLTEEMDGIFLWCLEGLKRLIAQNYCFSVSQRIKENVEAIQSSVNSMEAFLNSTGYIEFDTNASASTRDIYDAYCQFCQDNSYRPVSANRLSSELNRMARKFHLESTNNIYLADKRRVRGFWGIQIKHQVPY